METDSVVPPADSETDPVVPPATDRVVPPADPETDPVIPRLEEILIKIEAVHRQNVDEIQNLINSGRDSIVSEAKAAAALILTHIEAAENKKMEELKKIEDLKITMETKIEELKTTTETTMEELKKTIETNIKKLQQHLQRLQYQLNVIKRAIQRLQYQLNVIKRATQKGDQTYKKIITARVIVLVMILAFIFLGIAAFGSEKQWQRCGSAATGLAMAAELFHQMVQFFWIS